ncbi:MAG: hypothetical protein WCR42_01490 [bacterium]
MEELTKEERKLLLEIQLKMKDLYNLKGLIQLSEEHILSIADIYKLPSENLVNILIVLHNKNYIRCDFSPKHIISGENNGKITGTTELIPFQINLTEKAINQIYGKAQK